MRFERALVPLDGSLEAEAILPFIERIAGPLDMEIVLLRVVPPASFEAGMGGPARPAEPVVRELDAQGYLGPLVVALRAKGVRAEARVRVGDPAAEIVAAIREAAADLVAMTTHGRSGLGRLLFGSVAEAVLRAAPVPVLMMRMTEREIGYAWVEKKGA